MRWTQAEYDAYQARRAASGPKPKPALCHESVGKKEREAGDTGRIRVRITSYRCRLLDPDNLCPKYFVDCLRYSELIPNDRQEDIDLEVRQIKAKSRNYERTEIEIGL